MTEQPPHRKPPRSAIARRSNISLPLPAVRAALWEAACEMATAGSQRDIIAVLANRFRLPKRTVQMLIISSGMRHERVASTLSVGIANLLELSQEAADAVTDELTNVA